MFTPRINLCRFAAVLLLLCTCAVPCRAAEADPLALLQQRAADIKALSADFEQQTAIPLFDAPVISQGHFAYRAPDSLRWEYLHPFREGFLLQGNDGARWEGNAPARSFKPGENPQAAFIARWIGTWLRFDRAAIENEYTITIAATEPLTLHLVPKQADMAAVISAMIFVFASDGTAQSVTLHEAGGGQTRIRFAHVLVNQAVGPDEWHTP